MQHVYGPQSLGCTCSIRSSSLPSTLLAPSIHCLGFRTHHPIPTSSNQGGGVADGYIRIQLNGAPVRDLRPFASIIGRTPEVHGGTDGFLSCLRPDGLTLIGTLPQGIRLVEAASKINCSNQYVQSINTATAHLHSSHLRTSHTSSPPHTSPHTSTSHLTSHLTPQLHRITPPHRLITPHHITPHAPLPPAPHVVITHLTSACLILRVASWSLTPPHLAPHAGSLGQRDAGACCLWTRE
jgi:hypothetical protein